MTISNVRRVFHLFSNRIEIILFNTNMAVPCFYQPTYRSLEVVLNNLPRVSYNY